MIKRVFNEWMVSESENLENLENYLSIHFDKWIKQYANTSEGLSCEMKAFAEMELNWGDNKMFIIYLMIYLFFGIAEEVGLKFKK